MKMRLCDKIFYLLIGVLLMTACKKQNLGITEETAKDIAGTWKIVSLTRNGEDLTQRMDLSKFRIIFNANGSYSFQDKMAFVVNDPGTYQLDDPQFPFGLVLTPQSKSATKIKFQYPIINGKRQISLTISPGCTTNTYQYNFEKEK
jgi:hypothetical protein